MAVQNPGRPQSGQSKRHIPTSLDRRRSRFPDHARLAAGLLRFAWCIFAAASA
jgi:hypothetical protein